MADKGKVGQYLDDFKYIFASIDRKKITHLLIVLWVIAGLALIAAILEIFFHKVHSGDSYFLKIFLFCLWVFIFAFFFDVGVESTQEFIFESEWALWVVLSALMEKMNEKKEEWSKKKERFEFSRQELIQWVEGSLQKQYPNNKNIEKTIGGIIRRLRLRGYIAFKGSKGEGKYLWVWKN